MIKTIIRPRKFNNDQWKALITVRPKELLSSNSKLKKDGIWNFSLPAMFADMCDSQGNLHKITTCQGAGDCKNFCYASGGCYSFDHVMVKHHRNLQFMYSDPFEFVEQMVMEINKKKTLKFLRWHDAADFLPEFWPLYKTIMERCPNVQFYAYTKMVPFFKDLQDKGQIPSNFTLIFSFGGKWDNMIDINKDRHSRVFRNRKELRLHGYADCHVSDIPAAKGRNNKIGLIVHGSAVNMKIIKKNNIMNTMNDRLEAMNNV